jgi:hypothetical protein
VIRHGASSSSPATPMVAASRPSARVT